MIFCQTWVMTKNISRVNWLVDTVSRYWTCSTLSYDQLAPFWRDSCADMIRSLPVRGVRLPACRVAGVRRRGVARVYQPRSFRRHPNPQTPPPQLPRRISKPEPSPAQAQGTPSSTPSISNALASTSPADNNLLAPVHITEDPNAVLKETHPATSILANSGLVVQRQIEMMNIFLGFEQANRYIIMDPYGNHVGYMAEHDGGFGKVMGRQWLRTHRAFTTHVFNREQKEVLRV